MNTINYIKTFLAAIFSAVTYWLGGADVLLQVLIAFVCLDYISGIMAAIYQKNLNSKKGYDGILKKVSILIIVAVSHGAGLVTGTTLIRTAVVSFYVANEGISILENASRMDIPAVEKLRNLLEQIKSIDEDKR